MNYPAEGNSPAGRILVVEGDPEMADSIAMILGTGGEGHQITICSDGEEAFALATEVSSSGSDAGAANGEVREFDLILTEFRLPSLGGMDLLKKLHKDEPQRPVREGERIDAARANAIPANDLMVLLGKILDVILDETWSDETGRKIVGRIEREVICDPRFERPPGSNGAGSHLDAEA